MHQIESPYNQEGRTYDQRMPVTRAVVAKPADAKNGKRYNNAEYFSDVMEGEKCGRGDRVVKYGREQIYCKEGKSSRQD